MLNNIKAEDGKALQSYALFLRGCCTAMRGLQDMEELDPPSNLKLIVSKRPYKLRERWRTATCDILEQRNTRARLQDLVAFIERQANILQDPLFGDIQDPLSHLRTLKAKTITNTKPNTSTTQRKQLCYHSGSGICIKLYTRHSSSEG